MAEAVIIFFLRRLGYQLIQEGTFLSGVEDEVEWIRKEFQAMLAFLKDADKRLEREEIVADWIKEVRNLAYHAEDIIDEHVTRMATIRWYSVSFFKYFTVRWQIGQEIAKIKKEVVEVRERRDQYSFPGLQEDGQVSNRGTGGVSSRGPGLASPFVQEDDIVGIEDDVERLLSLLLKGDQCNRLVISIYGMGGIGKTTLVKEVFKRAKHRFDCFTWFFVSQSCNLRDVLRNVLFGFKASRGEPALDVMDAVDERWLLERTYEYLQGKNYLLVLDDIWDEKLWEEYKHALPQRKGRVILTTRIRNIESTAKENSIIHEPQPLPFELAWKVFSKKVFRPEGTCPEDLKVVAKEFVRRCAGLPLALVAIGGVLSSMGTNLPAWQSILRNFDWELDHHRDLERLKKALLFSYNHLPFYLKYGFLYTALFPQDYEIGRKRLIRMWIAEGFVKETQSRTEEEVANHYFVQLTDRSMIQAVTSHARDAVKACKVHDLMHDVANNMLNEEKFGQIFTEDGTIQERQRRLSVHGNADKIPPDISKIKLRTLLMFRVSTELSTHALKKLLVQLKLVRVLDFQGVPIEKLPDEIGHLIHLRYLDVRGTKIKSLPKSVKNLRNLQKLDVRNTEVTELPASINELQQLRHLLLSSFHDRDNGLVKMSRGRKCFLKLQTLSGVECDGGLVKEISSLTNLRKLCIGRITEGNSRELCQCLEGLRILRSLTMISESPFQQNVQMESSSWSPRYLEKLKLQMHMERLPRWFDYLDSLHTLYLFKNFLTEDPFPRLERLPNLTILTLASSAFTNKVVQCSAGFPRLKLLRILDIENWTTWMPIKGGCMPQLQFLLIADCMSLTSLPDGFNHLTSLHDLSLVGMSSNFSLKLQNEDQGKVSHVQEVSIISEVNGEFIRQ